MKIDREENRFLKRFNLHVKDLVFKINLDKYTTGTFEDFIHRVLNEIIQNVTKNYKTHNYIGLTFEPEDVDNYPFHVSFRLISQLDSDIILNSLNKILQSNQSFMSSGPIKLTAMIAEVPLATGRRPNYLRNASDEDFLYVNLLQKSVIAIENADNFCFLLAIILAIDREKCRESLSHIPQNVLPRHVVEARELDIELQLNVAQNGSSIEVIQKVSDYLATNNPFFNKRYRLVIFKSPKRNDFLLTPNSNYMIKPIYLAIRNEHFYVITSINGFLNVQFYCEFCLKTEHRRNNHVNCLFICQHCKSSPPCTFSGNMVHCNDCGRSFMSSNCEQNHKQFNAKFKESVCKTFRCCPICKQHFKANLKKPHECYKDFCYRCNDQKSIDHLCNITKYHIKQKLSDIVFYVFYDFECAINPPQNDPEKSPHEPLLLICYRVCNVCIDDTNIYNICNICGRHDFMYERFDVVKRFLQDLIALSESAHQIICIANNSKSYDCQFILNYIFCNDNMLGYIPEVIKTGNKITCLKLKKIKFIDSLNFLKSSIKNMPKMFGFEEQQKGFYPYLFLSQDNYNFHGSIPALEYYCADNMKSPDRKELIQWYEIQLQSNNVFDNSLELKRYCTQDVKILHLSCVKFRKIFMDQFNFDIFAESITLADACMKIFRNQFLEPQTRPIGLIPKNGYTASHNNSNIALEWLTYMDSILPLNHTIRHGRNGGEIRFPGNILVDGLLYVDGVPSNEVFEFFGCYWHQHTNCPLNISAELPYTTQELKNFKKISFTDTSLRRPSAYEVHLRDNKKMKRLREMGYKVSRIWECEYIRMKNINSNLKQFLLEHSETIIKYMNPRDCYMGGRTNAINLYFKAENGNVGQYKDIRSQYPFVMKTKPMPIGHPRILIGPKADATKNSIKISKYYENDIEKICVDWSINGIVYAKIYPPRNLFMPVLPDRINNKLIFHLCTKCVLSDPADLIDETCPHSDEERAIKRPFCTPELKEALTQGYRIAEIYEIYDYDMVTPDPVNNQKGLFTDYIEFFYKLKLQSDGWPSYCTSENEKDLYIARIKEHENIILDKAKVEKNPGLRQVAKLFLNSLYGKFGQKGNVKECVFINNHSELLSLLCRLNIHIDDLAITPLSDTKLLATFTVKEEFSRDLNAVNVVVAGFITCYARLELYKHLKHLNDDCLYFDTDCAIYVEKPNGYTIPTGDFLGDFTCELSKYGEGAYISEAIFLGAKNYAFEVTIPGQIEKVYECKVRGFTLNHKNKCKINFDTMKQMLFGEITEIDIENDAIRCNKLGEVFSKKEHKTYSMVYNKRRRRHDNPMKTFPYGY